MKTFFMALFLFVFGFAFGGIFVFLYLEFFEGPIDAINTFLGIIARQILPVLGIAVTVIFGIGWLNKYFLDEEREKLESFRRQLKEREKRLEAWERRLKEEEESYKQRLIEEYKQALEDMRKKMEEELEEHKWEITRKYLLERSEVFEQIGKKFEEVYGDAIKQAEKIINELRSRIHSQREHIKALNRKIENLRKFTEQRVIDIVAKAERNWILRGLKRRKDLQIIKEKLRKA